MGIAKNGSFLEKEFLSKEVSGRKVELDEVTVPSIELESSTLILLQCIYNFLLFHAIILFALDVLYALICYFILFLGLTY